MPHLGAAVVHANGAVLVDLDERAALIEMGQRERDSEFDRRQSDAALDVAIRGVPLSDFRLPRGELGHFQKLVRDFGDDAILDRHAVMSRLRRSRIGSPVVIRAANDLAAEAERRCAVIHDALDADRSLRTSEPPERGRGLRIGAKPARHDPDVRQEIGVVRVEHGAVGDRHR